jgi:transposase
MPSVNHLSKPTKRMDLPGGIRLDSGRFVWPKADSGSISLTRAQLSMLCEGIDWRRPVRTSAPLMEV